MTQLNDAKRLTEFLGECWHKVKRPKNEPTAFFEPCIKCGRTICIIRDKPIDRHHTFFLPDDWPDLGAVRNRLVETGKWVEFYQFADIKWMETPIDQFIHNTYGNYESDITEWLFYPPTFNRLVSEFLKGEKMTAIELRRILKKVDDKTEILVGIPNTEIECVERVFVGKNTADARMQLVLIPK